MPGEQSYQRTGAKLLAANAFALHVIEYWRCVDLYESLASIDQNHHPFAAPVLHEVEKVLYKISLR